MEETYTRIIIYSYLIFGSGILCDGKLEKRQTVSSCSKNTEDNFYCSYDLCINIAWVCDGRKDCPDGSDETKELCAQYEYGTNMNMDCGRVNVKNQVILKEDENKATVETAPWFVAIFELNTVMVSKPYDYLCVGSIIAPNVVISVADQFWKKGMLTNQISINDGQYKIAVGKYDTNFTVIDNDVTQIIDVEMIYLPEEFNGDFKYTGDISVLILSKKVSFRNGIAPVCIDWNSKYNLQDGAHGKMFYWGVTKNDTNSVVLLEISYPYINPSYCQTLIGYYVTATYDTFCGGSKLGPKLSGEDIRTTAISFLHYDSYFLTGVVKFMNYQPTYTILGFTGIKHHVQWIREIVIKHFTVNSCVLPIVEGVVYSYEGSNEILSHGSLINRHLTVIENCEDGYHKVYPNSFRFCLGKGKWLSISEKLCFKMCPPLKSDSLDIKCSHNCVYANCSNLSVPGTIATSSCKPTYTAPNGQADTPIELRCQSNGNWNKQLYRCNPNCGRIYIKNEVLIINGEQALVGTAPWNVAIYRLHGKNSNHSMICGGSIIASNLVISAAHCFWHKGMPSKRILVTDGLYKVAVGKYDRNFTIIDNEFTQIMDVEMVHLNEHYFGGTGFHAEDIAIIVLRNRLSFSNGVGPVCIDWNGKNNVVNGDKGKVVGWGKTEKGIQSPILLEASLPYINHSSCQNMFTDGFERFVTFDKFCAGSASGQGVGKGDSGAGLCFLHHDSYYLTGVVSIKDPNLNNSIAVFTEIKYHMQWIRGLFKIYN